MHTFIPLQLTACTIILIIISSSSSCLMLSGLSFLDGRVVESKCQLRDLSVSPAPRARTARRVVKQFACLRAPGLGFSLGELLIQIWSARTAR
eukprot:COSAG05_NODE_3409_length_2082_cov_1.852244_2_plen_93_part_00